MKTLFLASVLMLITSSEAQTGNAPEFFAKLVDGPSDTQAS